MLFFYKTRLKFNFTLFIVLLFCSSFELYSQNNLKWVELRQTPGVSFYAIKSAFDSAWAEREVEIRQARNRVPQVEQSTNREVEKLDGTFFQFKRWENFMEQRVYPSGDISLVGTTYLRFNEYLDATPIAKAQHLASVARTPSSNSWSFVGPVGAPTNSGAGRLCCVRLQPGNSNIIYVGAPAGGLWKSLDAGATWACLTDFLPVIGCSDVAIDPNNTNILYIATGDIEGDCPSIGVMKSIDGGASWNTTGLSFAHNAFRKIGKLLIDPTNSNILYAATTAGIFKTIDAGVNWYLATQSNTTDMEFKPGDPNTIYAGRVGFFKTSNAGATWTQIATGLPQSSLVSRIAIAVTPAAPDNVYVVAANSSTNASEGVYLSTNSGNSFVPQSGSPNLLGWEVDGSDATGQGWYDLSIAVANDDPNVVIVGGVNIWRSDDMGITFNINAHWYGANGAPYVHADCHDLIFDPNASGVYFAGCDGGIFRTPDDGNSFNDHSGNLSIAQIYRGGVSGSTPGTLISGHQDNGTNVKVGTNYFRGIGGDGMDCFIDQTTDLKMFGELYYGDFRRSTNGGLNWSTINNGTPGNGDWITPWEQDPVLANVLYAGFDQLYKTTNQGTSWSAVGNATFGNIKDIEISKSNNQVIYISTGASLNRSNDGGINWVPITGNLGGLSFTRIVVSKEDQNKVWVTVSGYTANSKIFYSANGGTTWTNISYGLPNVPANCLTVVPGTSNDAIFIGMDVGVYYRDNSSTSWQPFFTNLPNAPIYDLDIFLPTLKLTAFTYGRGVWEASIDQALLSPLANFSATPAVICPSQSVTFTDLSTFAPTSWSWGFPGGTPSTSTAQNPTVTYNSVGTFPVTLVATNNAGSGTKTQTAYICVGAPQHPPYTEGFVSPSFLPAGWSGLNVGNQAAFWKRSASVGHNSSESAYFDNYNNSINGEQDEMRSIGLNFSGYISLSMTFDVAYARYNSSRSDTLRVLISTNCGLTWTSVYLKGGNLLATSTTQTSAFTPSNNQWRTESINLNAYAGQGGVIIAFQNHGRHGNFLYLDNINITATANAAPVAAFTNASTICQNNSATFTDISSPTPTTWAWSFVGGTPSTSTLQNPSVVWSTSGTFTVSLTSSNSFGSSTSSQIITVSPSPIANAGLDTAICSANYLQLNASGGIAYSWTPTSGLSNSFIASPGIYITSSLNFSVTVTDINGCTSSDSVLATALSLPTFTINGNPSNICLGDTAELVCSNPSWAYTWAPSGSLNIAAGDSVFATPVSSTNYIATAVGTNFCNYVASKTIVVYPPLALPTILTNGWVLTCTTHGFAYQWYFNGNPIVGANQQIYTATTIGSYSVEASSYQGCVSGISPAVLVSGIAIQEVLPFIIAPNPNGGAFSLSFNFNFYDDFNLSIFTVDGKLVYIENLPNFIGEYNKKINLSDLGPGLYIIKLSTNKEVSSQHIIVY